LIRRLVSLVLVFVIYCFPQQALAEAQSSFPLDPDTNSPVWEVVSLSDFPPIDFSGSLPEIGRQWFAGQTPNEYLRLFDIGDSLIPQKLEFGTIARVAGFELGDLPLNSFELLKEQSLFDLAGAIPGLSQLPVGDIPAIASLVEESLGFEIYDIDVLDAPLSQALKSVPGFGDMHLSELSQELLGDLGLDSLPGLANTALEKLQGWQDALVVDIPGLGDIPLTAFPGFLLNPDGIVMRIDAVYGGAEASRHNTISGSGEKGFTARCADPDENCAYIELDDLENAGQAVRGPSEGQQWVSGKHQRISGGSGCLRGLNGGKEPVGRHPFGNAFKVAVYGVDETKDSVATALFFRVRIFCGESPYFLGPIPFINYNVNDNLFIGLPADSSGSDDYSEPYNGNDEISQEDLERLRSQIRSVNDPGVRPCIDENGNVVNGGSAANGFASGAIVDRIVSVAPANLRSHARENVPIILAALKAEGVTDPAQVAYVMATVELESLFGRAMREFPGSRALSTTNIDGEINDYYGRGYVQLTGKANYRKAGQRYGIDLMSNRELAADDRQLAASILATGMRDGWYTTRKLGDYVDSRAGRLNFRGARQVVNDHDKAVQIAGRAQLYYQAIGNDDLSDLDVSEATDASPQGIPTCDSASSPDSPASINGDTPQGDYANSKIVSAIQQLGAFDTSGIPGTDSGTLACAAAVNRVIQAAGFDPVGANTLYVPSVEQDLKNGRGVAVSATDARPGDIVLVDGGGKRQHIGFCLDNGCTRAISNSSSRAAFNWQSDGHFNPVYPGARRAIYRLKSK